MANTNAHTGNNRPVSGSLEEALYKDPQQTPEHRVQDLIARMSLEEKAAQMMGIWNEKAEKLVDEHGDFDIQKAKKAFKNGYGIGQVGRPSDAGKDPQKSAGFGKNARDTVTLTNQIQKFFIEHSRLGIPVIFHEECLHGLASNGATSFPQPIALGGTFNPALVENLYAMTAEEARVRGAHQALTPVVDVARDARWGRVEETFGEDPYLVSQLGVAAVKGFQGDASFDDKKHVIATLKHFAAHGEPQSGMNCAPVNISERVLRETFLFPFKEAITKANAIGVMASYNEIDGVPSHANTWLLRKILRDDWGFEGFVVSDYYGIWELNTRPDTHAHSVAKDKKEAAALAIKAGINLELPEPDCYQNVVKLVEQGNLQEKELDELIAPMLYWKFKLGLFEDPYLEPEPAEQISGSEANRAIALKAAQESITLLKNENDLPPLDKKKIKKIAVIGPNAAQSQLGGYSGKPNFDVTPLQGIQQKAGDDIEIVYAEGCKITKEGGCWEKDEVLPSNPEEDRKLIAEAVEVAQGADIIVLVIGGNSQTSRESWATHHMGDRTDLNLFGLQDELIDALSEMDIPLVSFLFNGRPLSVTNLVEKAEAIFECWYLGQETGRAVADALFGDINPSGKLPISIPRSVGHLPVYYNHKPSARRGYLFDEVSPLYPFGFGLSYTNFVFDNIRLSKENIPPDGTTSVFVDVTNAGKFGGAEVIQMYINDCHSSVTRPVKELKGFVKVWVEPGEKKTVELSITPESLAFWDINMEYTVEPGEFKIMVGNSSRDEDLTTVMLTVE